jgi:hypothetical protein
MQKVVEKAGPIADGSDGGRDERGRFTKGNPGGTGNPYSKRVAELRSALLDAITSEDICSMVRSMVERAKSSDAVAFRVISPYLFGKPIEAHRLEDGEDGGTEKGPILIMLPEEEINALDRAELGRRGVVCIDSRAAGA